MKRCLVCTFLLLFIAAKPALAQLPVSGSAIQRMEDILSALAIENADTKKSVQMIILSYLDTLEKICKERNVAMTAANELAKQEKELAESRRKKAWETATGKLNKLHAMFLGKLSSVVTPAQIETVKDVMTENGLQAEYKRFLSLLPHLTDQQKAQVKTYLLEARENAMDAETADMRRQWFIKFRGRANNFLAAAGYDLRKATDDLERKKQTKQPPKPLNNSYR